ncbi:MAG: ATP cone domain-containing protein [Candidatus Saccharibacteria bacterium]
MGLAIDIIKQNGHRPSETFSKEKLHASILAACLSVRTPVGQAESIAHAVSNSVVTWLETKPEVTSHDVRRVAAKHLRTHQPDAAYIYEQHRLTI